MEVTPLDRPALESTLGLWLKLLGPHVLQRWTPLCLQPECSFLCEPVYLVEPAIELHVFVCWGFIYLFKNLALLKADVQTLPDSGAACAHAVSPVLWGILQPKPLAAGGGQAPAELTFGRVAWRSERERDWRPG